MELTIPMRFPLGEGIGEEAPVASGQPDSQQALPPEPAFRILTLGPSDGIQYYAACGTCTYLSMPFDTVDRARWAAERHTWERHTVTTPEAGALPQAV
jgi:hypothetical protein